MTFDNSLPHALPWNYPWIKDEIERRDEYIAQLEAELAHQRPQNHDSGAIDGESVKVPAESETEAHSEPDSREKLEEEIEAYLMDNLCLDSFPCDLVSGWLDRQKAITERYWMQINGANTSANIVLNKRIAELEHQRTVMARKLMQAERDRDRYRAALGKAIDCADEIRRLS